MGNAQSQGEKKVDLAQKTGVLSLKETGLEKVPVKDLATIPNLRVLDLSHNKLRALPPKGLGKLLQLTTLTLDHNQVRAQCTHQHPTATPAVRETSAHVP